MFEKPTKQHEWLKRLLGGWAYEHQAAQGPDRPTETCRGREVARALGDLWVLAEAEGDMPGGERATSVMTLGYNPATGRFLGSWIGSMMSHMWVYDGELDEAGHTLTLSVDGPSFTKPGEQASYRDVITFESDDRRVLTSSILGDDGRWHEFMRSEYRRES